MDYKAPTSIDDAIQLLVNTTGPAQVLAGGTDLLVQIRGGFNKPTLVVDLKNIPELRQMSINGNGTRIGAAVSGAELNDNSEIKAAWPGIVEATDLIGSTQIQGRASLGGNLCNASPAADTVPALVAAGAKCLIAGPEGERIVPVEDLSLIHI